MKLTSTAGDGSKGRVGVTDRDASPPRKHGPAAAPADVSALVQLGAAAAGSAGAGGGAEGRPEIFRQTEGNADGFPLVIDGAYHFVASAAFMLDWMEKRIHFYDVALYLNESSPVWGDDKRNRTQDLERAPGDVRILITLQNRLATRKAMAALVDALILFARNRHILNYTSVLREYKACYRNGPRIPQSATVMLEPNRTGLACWLNGQQLCFVRSDFLGLLVLDHYLGPQSDFPELRDAAAAQLAEGMPSSVSQPRVVGVQTTSAWWVTVLIVLLGVLGCTGLLCFYHHCCRASSAER